MEQTDPNHKSILGRPVRGDVFEEVGVVLPC